MEVLSGMWIGCFLLIFTLAVALLPWKLAMGFTVLDWLVGTVVYFIAIKGKFKILRCVPPGPVQSAREEDETDNQWRKAA